MRFSRRLVEMSRGLDTPVLLLDRATLRRAYGRLRAALPEADCYYAVKANPHPEVLRTLAALGSGFEVSSHVELRAVRDLGVPASRVMSSNPIKAVPFIQAAYAAGVDRFAVDSRAELIKLAHHAPGSRVYVRLTVDNSGSEWPLAKKYGAGGADAVQLLREARAFGLQPYGLTFHVGSQCLDKESWSSALMLCHEIWRELAADGIALQMLSLGGGFPVRHTRPVPSVEEIGRETMRVVRSLFPADELELTVEPGRALVGDAAMLVATVIGQATRGKERWLYLDAGVFNALLEAIQGFRYQIRTERTGPPRHYVLAGPSCDSVDTIATDVSLPELSVGDRVYFLNAGAYTLSYASSFNGFEPPAVHAFEDVGAAERRPREEPALASAGR
ncbi:MAG TPA: type III PLP-dependent enzyme [Chloroflexota bacterium]|nr:type III PLP-dependent enzyme [Chloroflexota bacterium]